MEQKEAMGCCKALGGAELATTCNALKCQFGRAKVLGSSLDMIAKHATYAPLW